MKMWNVFLSCSILILAYSQGASANVCSAQHHDEMQAICDANTENYSPCVVQNSNPGGYDKLGTAGVCHAFGKRKPAPPRVTAPASAAPGNSAAPASSGQNNGQAVAPAEVHAVAVAAMNCELLKTKLKDLLSDLKEARHKANKCNVAGSGHHGSGSTNRNGNNGNGNNNQNGNGNRTSTTTYQTGTATGTAVDFRTRPGATQVEYTNGATSGRSGATKVSP